MNTLSDFEKKYAAIGRDVLQNELNTLKRLIAEDCAEKIKVKIESIISFVCSYSNSPEVIESNKSIFIEDILEVIRGEK